MKSAQDRSREDLGGRLAQFKLRRKLEAHSLPWQLCYLIWLWIQIVWVARRARRPLDRLEQFSAERKAEREAERLDRILNPHRYRGRE